MTFYRERVCRNVVQTLSSHSLFSSFLFPSHIHTAQLLDSSALHGPFLPPCYEPSLLEHLRPPLTLVLFFSVAIAPMPGLSNSTWYKHTLSDVVSCFASCCQSLSPGPMLLSSSLGSHSAALQLCQDPLSPQSPQAFLPMQILSATLCFIEVPSVHTCFHLPLSTPGILG